MAISDRERAAFIERVLAADRDKKRQLIREMRAYIKAERAGLKPDPKYGSELMRRSDAIRGFAVKTLELPTPRRI